MNAGEIFKSSTTVIWDWNGTLLNDTILQVELLNQVLISLNAEPVTFERFREIYDHPIPRIYEAVGVDLQKISFESISKDWHGNYRSRAGGYSLHDGALETIQLVKAAGKGQHILSALPQHLLDEAVKFRELESYFGLVRGSPQFAKIEKTETAPALLRELAVQPGETVLIGDASHDAEIAKLNGMMCILISDGLEAPHRLTRHGVPVFDNMRDLLNELR